MRLLLCLSALLALVVTPAHAADISVEQYGYPLSNPFEATIATTPAPFRVDLPEDDDIDQADYSLRLRPEREFTLPDNFWAVKRLSRQDRVAEAVVLRGRLSRGATVLSHQLRLHRRCLALRNARLQSG